MKLFSKTWTFTIGKPKRTYNFHIRIPFEVLVLLSIALFFWWVWHLEPK